MKGEKLHIGILGAAGLVMLLAAALIIFSSDGTKTDLAAREPFPVQIIGEVQVDGGGWEPLTADKKFETDRRHTIVIRGHFSREIPAGEELLFHISHLFVTLRIGGDEVWTNRKEERLSFLTSPGIAWESYLSPGIGTEEEVELELQNAYCNTLSSVGNLIWNMEVGRSSQLYAQMLRKNGIMLLSTICVILMGFIALTLAVVAGFCRLPQTAKAAALAFFGMISGFYILTDSNYLYIPLIFLDNQIGSICNILSLCLAPVGLTLLLFTYADEANRRFLGRLAVGCCVFIFMMLALQLFGILQLYEHQRIIIVVAFAIILAMLNSIFHSFSKRKNREAALVLLTMLPLTVGMLLGAADFLVVPFLPPRMAVQLGASITLALQILQVIHMIRLSSRARMRTLQLEKDLAKSRTDIMLSQIQPHFLYNSLTAIRQLCRVDPGQAGEAVSDFASFLRGNMDSLTRTTPIPFSKEMNHVQSYLALEQRRFGAELQIVYDIACTDFKLPALTLQPMVENAVRHGVMAREEGGAVTIRTRETETEWQIIVEDNGVGFDPSAPSGDEKSHIGVENVRRRLWELSQGELNIYSTLGIGTTIVISIPKRKEGSV